MAIAFFDDNSLETAVTHAMGVAYQSACHMLGLADRVDPLTSMIARKIVALAHHGENDPVRLCHGALASINRPAPPRRAAVAFPRSRLRQASIRRVAI